MNKKILHSALATLLLLIFVTPPLRGWGQTRNEVTDVLNQELTGVTGTSYSAWSGKKSNSDAVWAGQSAGGNNSIQLRSSNNNSGIITTASGGKVTKVVVTWNSNTANGRTLNVYGKNTAYTAATDLYDSSNQGTLIGTIVCGTSTELTIGDDYAYIGMRSASSAMYLSEIKVTWEVDGGSSTAVATTTTIDASGITNTDVYNGTAAGSLSATVTETESGNAVSGATVTWSGDNDAVATIDASSGEVTLVAAGSVTFTASYAGVTDEYQASSATYVMNVTSSAPSITFTDNGSSYTPVDAYHVALPCDASGGFVAHVVCENFQSTLTAENFTVFFCDVNGDALPVDPDWLEYVRVTLMPEWAQDETLYLEVSAYANETDESRTAYFKVWALNGENMVYSDIVTVTQAKVDYATLPFEWEGGSSATFNALTGVTTSGLGSDYSDSHNPYYIKFDSDNDYIQVKTDSQPGKVTIGVKMLGGTNTSYITVQGSADGETFTEVQTLTISGNSTSTTLNLETTNAFAATDRYVRMVFTKGSNVGVGPITIAKVSTDPSITLNTYAVEATAAETEGTLDITYANLTISDMSDFGIQFYDANEEELNGDNVPNWILVEVAEQDPQVSEGYVVSYVIDANTGEARTAYFKVFADGGDDFVYSNLVTVTQAAPVMPSNYKLTSFSELTPADVFVIVGQSGENYYALPHNGGTSSAPSAIEVVMSGEYLAASTSFDNIRWNISGNATAGYTFYPYGSATTWLYCTSSNNGVRVGTNSNNAFMMNENDYWVNIATSRILSIYNNSDWRCYENEDNNPVHISFYKLVSDNVDIQKDITGYESTGGYYLIAPPVATANPVDNGFLTANYDLYAFDQAQAGAEWRNYKAGSFNLVSGQGYLYASKNGAELHFVGQPYNGNGVVELAYTEGKAFAGWNLIGNPFATAATLDKAYYRLNSDGSELNAETESGSVAAMEGVFVKATEAGFAKFTATATQNAVPQLNVNLATSNRGSSTLDRAIIRFDEGSQLPKFMLNEANAKLYIPQGTKDYAVVRSNNEGSMPVNFKAATDGTYTLSIEAENVEMDYLHLIDNLTGADIDLIPLLRGQGGLNEPATYTFQARTSDYASRFRLVFSANDVNENVTSSETFAYFNGSEWVVNASEKATLQVIDVMGRVLSNETVSGSHAMSLNLGTGVYMLRLVNGNDVKVQKIVVR